MVDELSFLPQRVKPVEVKAKIPNNLSTEIDFGNGGSLQVFADPIDAGREITIRADSELNSQLEQGNYQIERPYEIQCPDCQGTFEAILTLPIETKGLSEEEMSEFQLAYRSGKDWVTVPSTVNLKERTVSGSISHLSLFSIVRWITGNRPPQVNLVAKPSYVYLGDSSIPDLQVEVWASDPNGDPLEVQVIIGVKTFLTEMLGEIVKFYKNNLT